MGYHNDLTLPFGFYEQGYKLVIDGFGIQILFRLVDDQRSVVGIVQRKVEKQ